MQDPLLEKQRNQAARLNRHRQAASDTSKEIINRREAFFERLALISGGALTFSVTLLGTVVTKGPHAKWLLLAAWTCLLLSLCSCLLRNIVHQHYQMADTLARMADSEVAYIDVDSEIITTQHIKYSDSPDPFNVQREVTLNRSNREKWKKTHEQEHRKAERYWRLLIGSEWTAGLTIVLGFALLVAFAIQNF